MQLNPKSKSTKLVQAAQTLPPTFSAEDLAVTAWRLFPFDFSMTGHNYPDLNCVKTLLVESRFLLKRGYIHRIRPNVYSLTDRLEDFVRTSEAYHKFTNGGWHTVTFSEACAMWGIRKSSQAEEAMASFEKKLSAMGDPEEKRLRPLWNLHRHLLGKFEKHLKLLGVSRS